MLRNFSDCPYLSSRVQNSEVPSGKALGSSGGHRFHRSVLLMHLKESLLLVAVLGHLGWQAIFFVVVVSSPHLELLFLVL